ncbi:MAG TPA: helix-turn-helix domain-containing protein [Nocardioides sp.]|nr:helix-turn-helix domain-containing protein [Nocardioides sp.]
MLADAWPTFALRIRTPRLTLRLPAEEELPALAQVAADGIHHPHERPFLTPWTETTPEKRARSVPGAWLIQQRVRHAQHLLEATDLGVDEIADRSGMGTAASLRTHLRTHVGVSPAAYRRTFRGTGRSVTPV